MERIAFNDLVLLKSLAEEVRDQTLSRSRVQEADRAIEVLERSLEAEFARSRAGVYLDYPDPNQSDGNWLQPYIEAALARGLCIKITCGTCSSGLFREGFVMLASEGRYHIRNVEEKTLMEIAAALALVEPETRDRAELEGYERAAMSIIYFLWSRSRGFDVWAPRILAASWAGKMLDRMRAHSRGQRRVPYIASP
jgi:hypothetical protein